MHVGMPLKEISRYFICLVITLSWLFNAQLVSANEDDPSEASVYTTKVMTENVFAWKQLPDVPDQFGLAGPVSGVLGDELLVAGGANFPDGAPWIALSDGSFPQKIYHDTIYLLKRDGEQYTWRTAQAKLPKKIGYGVTVSTPVGIISIGGEYTDDQNAKHLADDVFVIRKGVNDTIEISDQLPDPDQPGKKVKPLPKLPQAITAAAGVLIGQKIYIVGGATEDGPSNSLYRLDLSQRFISDTESGNQPDTNEKEWEWETLPAIPGPARVLPVVSTDGQSLYVFSGRLPVDGKPTTMLNDAWMFDPPTHDKGKTGNEEIIVWKRLPDIMVDGKPRCIMAGSAHLMGLNHIVIFGGAQGDVFLELERIGNAIKAEKAGANNPQTIATLEKQRNEIHAQHKGFSRDILGFHTLTHAWMKMGEMPKGMVSPVTTGVVKWGNQIVLTTGEKQPAVRTRGMWAVNLIMPEVSFGAANWTILVLYMGVLVGVGVFFAKRENTANDFFLGGNRIPWWAAGVSIFATMLSAITYLGIPATTYANDWVKITLNIGITLIVPIVAIFFLPFFRRLSLSTAYEYLEVRFNLPVRLFGSFSFIVFQLARMGIVVLLPAIALSAVTGIDIYLCIIAIGVLSTLYTYLGGIEAVIWTDVVQTLVLVGGAIGAIVIISMNIDGGFGQIITEARSFTDMEGHSKFHVVNWSADLTHDSILVLVLGAIFMNLAPYTSDQAIVQRYMTTPDEKQARQAIWMNGVLVIPASLLFFFVGTALWVFFKHHPGELIPLEKQDQIFPWFIAHQMPAGLAGIVIAGVFAAAMSSLDSSIHSIATSFSNDVVKRFKPEMTDHQLLSLARWATLILGVLGTISAAGMASADIKSLWDAFMGFMNFLLGTLGGLFMLGIFTKRPCGTHALIAAFASACALVWLKYASGWSPFLGAVVAYATCMVVGVLVSYIIPIKQKPLDGLTWYTMKKDGT